jgi:hypothetical protein
VRPADRGGRRGRASGRLHRAPDCPARSMAAGGDRLVRPAPPRPAAPDRTPLAGFAQGAHPPAHLGDRERDQAGVVLPSGSAHGDPIGVCQQAKRGGTLPPCAHLVVVPADLARGRREARLDLPARGADAHRAIAIGPAPPAGASTVSLSCPKGQAYRGGRLTVAVGFNHPSMRGSLSFGIR